MLNVSNSCIKNTLQPLNRCIDSDYLKMKTKMECFLVTNQLLHLSFERKNGSVKNFFYCWLTIIAVIHLPYHLPFKKRQKINRAHLMPNASNSDLQRSINVSSGKP